MVAIELYEGIITDTSGIGSETSRFILDVFIVEKIRLLADIRQQRVASKGIAALSAGCLKRSTYR